jgi:hypothetical protein
MYRKLTSDDDELLLEPDDDPSSSERFLFFSGNTSSTASLKLTDGPGIAAGGGISVCFLPDSPTQYEFCKQIR